MTPRPGPTIRCLTVTAALLLAGGASAASAGPLEQRALAHDAWANSHHFTPYGGIGYAHFASRESTEVVAYSISDSTIWTGTYLAAEAFRFAETGDPQAKANAIRTVHALDAHLRVTGVPGFISRCVAPDVPPYNSFYQDHDRYVPGEGEWEGSFWINNTSRDQYTGWFFGMALAYDLIDDEPMRGVIRAAVKEVVDELVADDWVIRGEDGRPTDAAPRVILHQRLAWTLIAAHVLEDARYYAYYEQLYEAYEPQLEVDLFSWLNKYDAYFGFNLSYTNIFNLLRLDPEPGRRARILEAFERQVRRLTEGTHNVFFDVIYLSQCRRSGGCRRYAATAEDIASQLPDFQDPPVRDEPKAIPELELDPVSVFLADLIDELGLRDLLDIEYQTLEPRPVRDRCPRSFMWQKSPYNRTCPGGPGTEVYPGVDYMIAYWMGRHYGFIDPDA